MPVPDILERQLRTPLPPRGRALANYTLILLEMANQSRLHVERSLSVSVRLLFDGQLIRPVRDAILARQFAELMPEQELQRIPGRPS